MAEPIEPEVQVEDDVSIPEGARSDPDLLNKEFAKIPGDISYWSAQYSLAVNHVEVAQNALKELDASLLIEFTKQGGSAALVRAKVVNDIRRKFAMAAVIRLKDHKVRLQGQLRALKGKESALITIGANMRAELGTTTFHLKDKSDPETSESRNRRRLRGR